MVCTGTSVVQLHALRWRILFQYLALGVQCFIFEDSSYLGNLTWYFPEIYPVSSLECLMWFTEKIGPSNWPVFKICEVQGGPRVCQLCWHLPRQLSIYAADYDLFWVIMRAGHFLS